MNVCKESVYGLLESLTDFTPKDIIRKVMFGKILFIDLTEKSWRVEDLPSYLFTYLIGGKGLGTYLLFNKNSPHVDPLSAQNNLIIALGPATDTGIWGSSRYGVYTKSPLTGLYAESYSGGNVAEPMSRTGYDAFVIYGSSYSPVFLEINEEEVFFRDASQIWGKDTYLAEDEIRRKVGRRDAGIIVIGPAGENLIRFASIVNNRWRCAGRSGTGSVLGSKKVKGIAFYGSKKRPVASEKKIKELKKSWLKKGMDMPSVRFFRSFGTCGLVSVINGVKAFPSYYWRSGELDGWESLSAESLHMNFKVRSKACRMCFLACARLTEVTHGKFEGLRIEGPEYETIYAIGGLCGIKKLEEIIYINDICDRLGMDTITAGNLVAFAIEASRLGKIKERIDYGQTEKVADLLFKIAKKEGIGEVLSYGIVHAAKEWDLEDMAIHVKGMEPGGYDPRYFFGMALAYATSDRGACHMRSTVFRAELSGLIPPQETENKAEVMIDYEDRHTLQDSLIICRFYRDLYTWNELSEIIEATLGLSFEKKDLQRIASHIRDAVRIYNLREGMDAQADTLPKRFFEEPLGPAGFTLKREDFEKMKRDYYRIRGWKENGEPVSIPPFLQKDFSDQ